MHMKRSQRCAFYALQTVLAHCLMVCDEKWRSRTIPGLRNDGHNARKVVHLRGAALEPPTSLGRRVAQRCRGHCPCATAASTTCGSAWTRDANSHIASERSTASTSCGPSSPHTCSGIAWNCPPDPSHVSCDDLHASAEVVGFVCLWGMCAEVQCLPASKPGRYVYSLADRHGQYPSRKHDYGCDQSELALHLPSSSAQVRRSMDDGSRHWSATTAGWYRQSNLYAPRLLPRWRCRAPRQSPASAAAAGQAPAAAVLETPVCSTRFTCGFIINPMTAQ